MNRELAICAAIVLSMPHAVQADSFGSGINSFEIEFVTVGDPGNPADTTGAPNPAGSVSYSYRIGKYEISEELVNKAVAQAADDGQILDVSTSNRGPNKPATNVSWFEAAQFVNWLNTSEGFTPAYKFEPIEPMIPILEFELWEPEDSGYDPDNLFRNSNAKYFLPSVDEWYKAAYFDPVAGVYYDYATGSDTPPDGIDFPGDTDFEAVFLDGGSNPMPNEVSNVGLLSPYGTGGQSGNVAEWEETEFDLLNDSIDMLRGVNSGLWNGPIRSSSRRGSSFPRASTSARGFRIASIIPEPSAFVLAIFALSMAAIRRR